MRTGRRRTHFDKNLSMPVSSRLIESLAKQSVNSDVKAPSTGPCGERKADLAIASLIFAPVSVLIYALVLIAHFFITRNNPGWKDSWDLVVYLNLMNMLALAVNLCGIAIGLNGWFRRNQSRVLLNLALLSNGLLLMLFSALVVLGGLSNNALMEGGL